MLENYLCTIQQDLGYKFEYICRSGWDYDVIIAADKFVYRFPKQQKSEESMNNEREILNIISQHVSIKIPRMELIWTLCFKYELIKGESMDDYPFTTIHKKLQESITNDLVRFLRELHSIPKEAFLFRINKEESDTSYAESIQKNVIKRLEDRISSNILTRFSKYMDELFSFDPPDKVFSHTDLQWKNLIYDQELQKISGIIDFSDSRFTSREIDFCHFLGWGDELFSMIIVKYLWYYDYDFVERVKFLHKRHLIFEILNDDIYVNQFDYLQEKLESFS